MPSSPPRGRMAGVVNGALLAGVAAGYGLWFGCRLAWAALCLPMWLAGRCRRGNRP